MLAPAALATALLLAPPALGPDELVRADSTIFCGITAFVLRVDVDPALDSIAIRAVVERELTREGIQLVGRERPGTPLGSAALLVTLRVASGSAHPVHGGMTLVEVLQEGRILRAPDNAYRLITWRRGGAWLAGTKSLARVVEASVRHQMANFAGEYRKATCLPVRVRRDSVVAGVAGAVRRTG